MSSNQSTGSESASIIDTVRIRNGFATFHAKLRSILMHPMGMLLTTLLNDVAPPNIPSEEFWRVANGVMNDPNFLTYTAGTCDRDDVLAAAILKWDGKPETGLTTIIKRYVEALSNTGRIDGYGGKSGSSLQFQAEKGTIRKTNTSNDVVPSDAQYGLMDFVISEVENDSGTSKDLKRKPPIVAIFEIGINHDAWWVKTDQILEYVNSIRSTKKTEDCKFSFDQPILLTVMTIQKNADNGNDAKRKKSSDLPVANQSKSSELNDNVTVGANKMSKSDDNIIVADYDVYKKQFSELKGNDNGIASVQCGVFLCIPKGDTDYRIALLWRTKTDSLTAASTQFGKLLFAAKICTQLRKSFSQAEILCDYRYLGPNCCKIGMSVSIYVPA